MDATDAVIVISSSSRQIPIAYIYLKEWLEKFGVGVYDKTPYVGVERGDDITAWFNRHTGDCKNVILERQSKRCGVHSLCRALGVSESGYYRYLHRKSRPSRDVLLSAMMQEILGSR